MANKVTKKDNFKAIVEVLANAGRDDLVEVMNHELELLAKKSNKSSKANEQKKADNAVLQDAILEVLENSQMTATELAKALSTDKVEYSNQKMSAMLRALGDKVTKETIKGKTYFSLA